MVAACLPDLKDGRGASQDCRKQPQASGTGASGANENRLHKMSWETRAGRRYYYRAEKVAGRVVKEYIGAGEVADAIASLDALDRQAAALQAQEQRQARVRLDDVDAAVEGFCRTVDAAVRAALTQAGYHQHDRGLWRKRRGNDGNKGHDARRPAACGEDKASSGSEAQGGGHGAF